MDNSKSINTVLQAIPHKTPFRFIDDILEISSEKIISTYTFRPDEYFYKGHFENNPITPGVILIETMAQTGVVALGIFQLMEQGHTADTLQKITPLFAFADQVEFSGMVKPGDRVEIQGDKIYFRKGTIKSKVVMRNDTGGIVCQGILTGVGVSIQ